MNRNLDLNGGTIMAAAEKNIEPVHIEDLCHGPLFVADTAAARANKAMLERHFALEWACDIDGTMSTMHPDNPWQRIPALGVDVVGFDAVRDYYLKRFDSWPGRALAGFDRVTVADTCIYTEGMLDIQPTGAFGGIDMAGRTLRTPVIIVVDFRDGLVLGETVYMDASAINAGSAN